MPTGQQLLPKDNMVPPIWGRDAETAFLDVIVFSKDRACQLDALLRSMREFFGLAHRIYVVYTTTSPEFELGYDMLRRWHTGINWVVEDDPFKQTLQRLVAKIGRGEGKYLMFLVDDMMFTRPFTAKKLMVSLDDDENILAVSLRMGENITYCYTRNTKTTPPDFSNGYRWQWKTASEGYWNYPMSQDGHIFRTSDFATLLPGLEFQNPNTLEARQSGQPFSRPDMVCEANPCVINIAANRVQSFFKNRCGNISPEFLNESFLQGLAIDVSSFTDRDFNACHIEEDLPLISDSRSRICPPIKQIKRGGRAYFQIDLRKIPTFILNCKDDNKKRLLMEEQLTELGFNFEFIRTMRVKPGWVGVALGHMKALRLSRAQPPFLILEDDCVFSDHFQPVIEIPVEAEALYLGTSIFGIEKPGKFSWGKANNVVWENFDEGYLRVHNMLARHAVLYLDENFQTAVIESQVEALTNRHLPHMGDIGLAMLQEKHITLLTERNVCRQVNRDATNKDLAVALPKNELKYGQSKKIESKPETGKAKFYLAWVSHKYRFVYFQIAKNASSTLKAEFSKPRYECEQISGTQYHELDLSGYLKFTFLRDPISRLLSAYHEISFRGDVDDSSVVKKPFMALDDDLERFRVFLREIEKGKWDQHVRDQADFVDGIEIDFFGRIESINTDFKKLLDKLDIPDCPVLPVRRSRLGRKNDYNYDRFNIDLKQLTCDQVDFILNQYRDDVSLIEDKCPKPSILTAGPLARKSSQACALEIDKEGSLTPLALFTRVNEMHDRYVVYRFGDRGFYAEVSSVARAMIYAWVNGYQLLLDGGSSKWACDLGWEDYFESFCPTPEKIDHTKIAERFEFLQQGDRTSFKKLRSFMPQELSIGQVHLKRFEKILDFFVSIIFQPAASCQATVNKLTASLDLPLVYDAIHVRRGDKVGDEDAHYFASEYLQALGSFSGQRTLFVMSDSWDAVEEVQVYLDQHNANVRVVSLVKPERTGFDVWKLRRGEAFLGDDTKKIEGTLRQEYVRDHICELIAETMIASRARRVVSTFRSNVGRIIRALHSGQKDDCVLLAKSPNSDFKSQSVANTAKKVNVDYLVHLQLRGEKFQKLVIPADHKQLPLLQQLEKNLLNDKETSCFELIQVPMDQGRSVLSFSSSDVKSIKLLPPSQSTSNEKSIGKGHHAAMNMAEGHLGGYISSRHSAAIKQGWEHGDPATYTPVLWRWLVDSLDVKSVLDVGCAEGHASSYFQNMGCRIQGIDGSAQAFRDSLIPDNHHCHDYQDGPHIPKDSWDMVWSCEFVEHVDEKFTQHFLATFACARKYVVMSFAPPGQPGWHHVNCQPKQYWIDKVEKLGFSLDQELTEKAKILAKAGHFHRNGLVFVRTDKKPVLPVVLVEETASQIMLPVNDMPVAKVGNNEFLLFLDIFVHPYRNKIVAVMPWYNNDWQPLESDIDFKKIELVYRGKRIGASYIPHRLDSWEPCALLDFEHPDLEQWLKNHKTISFQIEVGTHTKKFKLSTIPPPAYNVLMSLVIKNENRWLKHFLEYYFECLNVDHILVYDNFTDDRATLLNILQPYMDEKKVTYIPWHFRWRNINAPRKMIAQPQQESHSLNRFANSRWIGFFDVDEFLRLPGKMLPEFLSMYQQANVDGLSFGLRWFQYEGALDFDEIVDTPLTFRGSYPSRLGRKRQKLFVSPQQSRFLRLHNLEEGGRELQIDDTDIFFHHYCQRDFRFKKNDNRNITQDNYMLQFADQLRIDGSSTIRPSKPVSREGWVQHITNAVAKAEYNWSRLNSEALDVPGYCGAMTRHFYNNLCNVAGCRYLEIGSFNGASTVAAMFGNELDLTCIDNFSQFRGTQAVFESNVQQFKGDNAIKLITDDCFNMDTSDLGPFDIYLYDSAHDYDSQYKAIANYVDTLAPLSIVIIDDWNWQRVRKGTSDAIRRMDIDVVYQKEIIVPDVNDEKLNQHNPDKQGWWNGICIMLIDKNK